MRTLITCVGIAASIGVTACGGGADVSVALTSGRGLAASAAGESMAREDGLYLHVVRTEIHLSNGGSDRGEPRSDRTKDENDGGDRDAGWMVVSNDERDVNLSQLAGTPEEIADGEVPEGKVTQLRLILASDQNATWVVGDEETPVVVSSGEETGLKLHVSPPVTLSADRKTTFSVTIDGVLENGAGVARLSPSMKVAVAVEAIDDNEEQQSDADRL